MALIPHTGEQLTAKLIDDRIAAWDVTASVPKGVTIALERGDDRIHDAIWEAGRRSDGRCWRNTPRRACGWAASRRTG